MTVHAIRRKRLTEFVVQRFGGNASHLARALWKQQSYISELLSGKRSFGEKVARQIEARLGLAHGYLDHRIESVTELGVMALTEAEILERKMRATADQHLFGKLWRLGALLNATEFPERDEALEILIGAMSWHGQVQDVNTGIGHRDSSGEGFVGRVLNQDEMKAALRAIGLALNATHNTVATDRVKERPGETNSWRVDHSNELALLDALEASLLSEKTCLDEIGVIRQRLGVLLETPDDELIDAVYQFALWRIEEHARLPIADCRADSSSQ